MQNDKDIELQEVTDAIQQFEIGVDYYKGRNGKKQDRSKAVMWYLKSAEQGYHKAQFSLGYCYNYGKGVTRDYIEAVEWYKKAVEQGDAYAQYNLGVCYNNGEGVIKDKKKAIALWEESAKNGYDVARITLERLKDIETNSENVDTTSTNRRYSIFISYKRIDKETVFSIKDKIERETGQKCWIDLDGIESDQQFANVIINAINNADTVLFMYSQAHSLIEHYENDWTIRELNFAQEKGKRIVFVNIDKSPLTDWFRLVFGTKQQVDATSDFAIGKLLEDLRAWNGEKTKKVNNAIGRRKEKTEYKIFCGGTFCFDYLEEGYEAMAAEDYRAELLGSVDSLLRPDGTDGVEISKCVTYVGPFYFETESMKAEEIICCEKRMMESSTDAIFILDDASCPGTIAELMYANSLQKTLHLFYVHHKDDEETESVLHTPCWYPILFCQMTNKNVCLYPCSSIEDAVSKIQSFVESLKQ